MKFLKSNSVFDSFKVSYYLNKFSGYWFFTIKRDMQGNYTSATTVVDLIILLLSVALSTSSFLTVIRMPLKLSSRSVILDIGVYILSKIVVLSPIFIILLNFYHRHECFRIIKTYHTIDQKVEFNFIRNCDKLNIK